MRNITKQIAAAFKAGIKKANGNTMTDGKSVWLHGNKIAENRNGVLFVSLAGWNTNTTRERVNGILCKFGHFSRFSQLNFAPYFGGKQINSNDWINAETGEAQVSI